MPINRIVYGWSYRRHKWVPQMRVCHLHAIEACTGKPVPAPTFESKQRDMSELSA